MGKSFHRNKFEEDDQDLEAQKVQQANFREARLRKLAEKQAELNKKKDEE